MTRRTWLEWLGGATVLSLGSLAASCATEGGPFGTPASDTSVSDVSVPVDPGLATVDVARFETTDSADAVGDEGVGLDAASDGGPDASDGGPDASDGGPDASDMGPDSSDGGFAFQPGGDVGLSWPVRTVDPQDLEKILAEWTLTIDGMVANPLTLSFAQLLERARQDQVTDFHCVEGWSVLDVPWNGVHLSTLFDEVSPLPDASYVTFHTVPGKSGQKYDESLPLPIALEPRTLLAYGVNESTLPLEHGFPLRIVIPRLFAYKSAKYVTRIELTDKPIKGFWVAAGYGYDAEVPPERLREGKY